MSCPSIEAEMQPTTEEIFAALRTCRDPEIPVNLVDLQEPPKDDDKDETQK